jgi:hypothetical protein
MKSMYKVSGVFLSLIMGIFIIAPTSWGGLGMKSVNEPNGVYCEINDVKLFALSAEDCAKAGGSVTHTVKTTVEPANPDQEPEIQRTKDKEPVPE